MELTSIGRHDLVPRGSKYLSVLGNILLPLKEAEYLGIRQTFLYSCLESRRHSGVAGTVLPSPHLQVIGISNTSTYLLLWCRQIGYVIYLNFAILLTQYHT